MVAWICDSIDKAAWIRHGVMSVAYREPAEPDGRMWHGCLGFVLAVIRAPMLPID